MHPLPALPHRRAPSTPQSNLTRTLALLALFLIPQATQAFYFPGTAPVSYADFASVPPALTPVRGSDTSDSLRSLLSYPPTDARLHLCPAPNTQKDHSSAHASLPALLFGDQTFPSAFDLRMRVDEPCTLLCEQDLPAADAAWLAERIEDNYAVHMLVDGLPAAARFQSDLDPDDTYYAIGIPLGRPPSSSDNGSVLHTHYDMELQYHFAPDKASARVVGVIVWPSSHDSAGQGFPDICTSQKPLHLLPDSAPEEPSTESKHVIYTYSVRWTESETPWATRWDHYLRIFNPNIHWLSLINSIVVAALLSAAALAITARSVSQDLARYAALDLSDDVPDEFGWKLLHADVLRPPVRAMVLSVAAANGLQLASVILLTLFFALLGLLSPANRGDLTTAMVVFHAFSAVISGYVSTRLYTSLAGHSLKRNTLYTALAAPLAILLAVCAINLFLVTSGSSGAVPFRAILTVSLIWFAVSVPLTFLGARYGGRHGPIPPPVRTARIPRQIPDEAWYFQPFPSAVIASLAPFGAAFIELFFILSSLFGSRIFAAFGFLFLCNGVVVITTIAASILLTYITLCKEDYRWHWRSFFIGAGIGLWTFIYGLYFMYSRLHLAHWTSAILYIGYLLMICAMISLAYGSIAFLASAYFVHRLYRTLRMD